MNSNKSETNNYEYQIGAQYQQQVYYQWFNKLGFGDRCIINRDFKPSVGSCGTRGNFYAAFFAFLSTRKWNDQRKNRVFDTADSKNPFRPCDNMVHPRGEWPGKYDRLIRFWIFAFSWKSEPGRSLYKSRIDFISMVSLF